VMAGSGFGSGVLVGGAGVAFAAALCWNYNTREHHSGGDQGGDDEVLRTSELPDLAGNIERNLE